MYPNSTQGNENLNNFVCAKHFAMHLLWFSAFFFVVFSAQSQDALQQHLVFAHYMMCCPEKGGSATIEDFKVEIRAAQSKGIDGFALNCGNWLANDQGYKQRSLRMYSAAQQLGTGFKLFVSVDGSAQKEIDDVLESVRDLPNQFKVNGRPVLSTFGGGGPDGSSGQLLIGRAATLNAFFVPHFFPKTGEAQVSDQIAVDLRRLFGAADGYFYFGAAGEGDLLASSIKALANVWVPSHKVFIAGISPYYRGMPGVNYRAFETHGFESMSKEWEAAIISNTTWVELVTWNDWQESSYLSPFLQSKDSSFWKGIFGPKLPSHKGYLDASQYYIEWFKTGKRPTISEDAIFYFYRLHPGNPNNTLSQYIAPPKTRDGLVDDVFVTVHTISPATLIVYSGNSRATFQINSGVNSISTPFSFGAQRFQLVRQGKILLDKTGEELVGTDQASRYNYFSGSTLTN